MISFSVAKQHIFGIILFMISFQWILILLQAEGLHASATGGTDLLRRVPDFFSSVQYSLESRFLALTNTIWISLFIFTLTLVALLILISCRYLDTVKFRTLRSFYMDSPSPLIVLLVNILASLAFFLGGWIFVFFLNIHNLSKKELYTLLVWALLIFLPFGIILSSPGWFDGLIAQTPSALLRAYDRSDLSHVRLYRDDPFIRENPLYLCLLAQHNQSSGTASGNKQNAALLQRALSGGYTSTAVYNNLGNAMLMLNSSDAALSHYDRALSRAPEDPIVLYNISQYYLFRNDYDTAKVFYDKAFTLKGQLELPVLDWENIILLEKTLDPDFVWRFFLGETARREFPQKAFSQPQLFLFPGISVFLILLIIFLFPLTSNWASFVTCESCGIPIIPGSATSSHQGRIFCSRCHLMLPVYLNQKLGKDSMATKIDTLKHILFNLIIPGGGYILKGHTLKGLFWLLLTTTVLTFSFFNKYFLITDYSLLSAFNRTLDLYPAVSFVSTVLLLFCKGRKS
ncbi:MAG TPA: hypothetical protein ENN72_08355 [Firmicutes bacterium]|nr:hypothetical protein [Bacillota bacterium]